MAQIHFIDGEKGGVGKSLFARTMVQYCLDKNIPFHLVEADGSNPDVGEFYPDVCQHATFSEDEKKSYDVDIIFELALSKPVIVNLPAQVYPVVTNWIRRNGLLESEIVKEHKLKIYKWFVCTGGHDSVQLFIKSAEEFQGKVQHIFVRNNGLSDEWKHLDDHEELNGLLNGQKIPIVDFPRFSYKERNLIDQKRITFASATAKENQEFPILSKQRITNYLRDAYAAIEETKFLFQDKSKANSKGHEHGGEQHSAA